MTTVQSNHGASVTFEPELKYQFLPGCPNCHQPHPLARKMYKGDPTICPDCGGPAGTPGEVRTEKAQIAGITGVLFGISQMIGRALFKLAKRI